MRIDRRSSLHATVLAALAVGTLLLGGCAASPDPEPDSTAETPADPQPEQPEGGDALSCENFAALITETLPLMFVMFDTDGTAGDVAEAFRELSDRWNGLTPPEPIAGDWPVVAEWAEDYAVAWEATPPETAIEEAYNDISADFEDEDAAYDAAMENVTAYVDAECPQADE